MYKKVGLLSLAFILVTTLLINFSTVFALGSTEIDHNFAPTQLSSLLGPFEQNLDVNGDQTPDIRFHLPDIGYSLDHVHTIHTAYTFMEEKEWIYNVRFEKRIVGEFHFTLKQIEGRELVYFLRYTPIHTQDTPLMIELQHLQKGVSTARTPISEMGESKIPSRWADYAITDQSRELPMGSLYIEDDAIAYRVGNVDAYSDLGYSVRDQLLNEQVPATVVGSDEINTFIFSFSSREKSFSETWGIFGDKELFNWESPAFSSYFLSDDFSINKKLTKEGLLYRLPTNYQPYSKNGFYLNPANIMALRALDRVGKNIKGRLLKDFVIMIGYMSIKNQNDQGFWPTQPKSSWLEQDYQIGYNYYDNRRNADNATFLLALYQHYPDPIFKTALERHVSFLYQMIDLRSIYTSEWGLLFTDYTGSVKGKLSHVALNHHLAVLNFLLKWENATSDRDAAYYSMRMLTGIKDTAELWVKEDHNLYYGLYKDLSPMAASDYFDLTLTDLEVTKALLQKRGKENPAIQYLIDHKREWVTNQLRIN